MASPSIISKAMISCFFRSFVPWDLRTTPILRQQRDWVGGVRKMTIFADIQYYFCWRRVSGWVRKSPKMFWLSIRMVSKRKKKVILKKPQIQTTTIYTHQQTRTTNCWNIWILKVEYVSSTNYLLYLVKLMHFMQSINEKSWWRLVLHNFLLKSKSSINSLWCHSTNILSNH